MSDRPFIHDDFMLDSEPACALYHGYAADLPIIDYHSHLPPHEIAGDRRWADIAEIWLGGDHYKWRAMRAAGVDERYCTGDADPWQKFEKFAGVMPKLLRNPLYHWSHLELARYFGIADRLLDARTARGIYDACNQRLSEPDFSCRGLLRRFKVEVVCTTDDPVDSLEHHRAIASEAGGVQVRPTWRPDRALAVDRPDVFGPWIAALEQAADREVANLDGLLSALRVRHDFFGTQGCRLSDRGIETVWAEECSETEAARVFAIARAGGIPTAAEAAHYKSFLLHELARMDAEKGWTMQLHLGALRGANARMRMRIGNDCGFDSIGDWQVATALAKHLDRLDSQGALPKTILYNLNPCDNEVLATMIGNFQDGITPGKMQFGTGWWFLDQEDGMTRQIEALSQMGLLSQFVGMLTDSRSFLSFTRHEYFRRLLCNILGRDMVNGRVPSDLGLVGGLVADICYHNARRYFGFYEAQ